MKHGDDVVGTFPCQDVGMVVVDHPQTTYTHGVLARLMEAGAVVVICGQTHLPAGLLLPMTDHTEVVWRLEDQVRATLPTKKRLWQQIVQAKILGQAENLAPGTPTRTRLTAMAGEVKSGDAGAHESQAARAYWQAWLTEAAKEELPRYLRDLQSNPSDAESHRHPPDADDLQRFRRDTEGDGLNALLNYGYAIVRAAMARAIVAAGLQPALGIQHRNRGNPLCLADDLMEPLRPMVDRRARRLWWGGQNDLDQPTKAGLLSVLTDEVSITSGRSPLQVALHRYTASYVRCLRKEDARIAIPKAVSSPFS